MRTDQVDLQQANVGHLILAMGHDGTQKAFEKVGDDEWQRMGAGINYSDAGVRAWAFDYCDLEQRQPIQVPPSVARDRLQAKLGDGPLIQIAAQTEEERCTSRESDFGRRCTLKVDHGALHNSYGYTWDDAKDAVEFTDALDKAMENWHAAVPEERLLMSLGFHAGYYARGPQPVIEVHHHDTEKHAESFNEGYEAAMAHQLMTDEEIDALSPEEWLKAKIQAARLAVDDEAVERVRSYMEMCRRSDETRHVANPGEPSGADLVRAKAVIAAFLDVDWQAGV